jgi:hypothetical protein
MQGLTLAEIEKELYPDRAEFGRRRGSKNKIRRSSFGAKKRTSLAQRIGGTTTAGRAVRGAAAAGAIGGLAALAMRGKGRKPRLMGSPVRPMLSGK